MMWVKQGGWIVRNVSTCPSPGIYGVFMPRNSASNFDGASERMSMDHEGDHDSDQELHVNVRVGGETIWGKDAPPLRHLAGRVARHAERRSFD